MRRIKHCRVCGAADAVPRAGRRQPRPRHLHRLRRGALREPAQRGRHGAGVGRAGAAVPAQHRAALRPVDAAGRLHGAGRDHGRGRAARDGRRSRRAHRTAGPVHAAQRGARRPGAPVLPRPAAGHALRARPRDHRGAAVPRARDPVGRSWPFAPCARRCSATSPTAAPAASSCTWPTSAERSRSAPGRTAGPVAPSKPSAHSAARSASSRTASARICTCMPRSSVTSPRASSRTSGCVATPCTKAPSILM